MARPLRLEFAGALYHITSRGDRREAIYRAADDREAWLEVLGNVCARFNWVGGLGSYMTVSRAVRELLHNFTLPFCCRVIVVHK